VIPQWGDGHRISFNMTFKEFGFTDEWSVDYYHELLQIGGGKERIEASLEAERVFPNQ